jgi:hypothetical protein
VIELGLRTGNATLPAFICVGNILMNQKALNGIGVQGANFARLKATVARDGDGGLAEGSTRPEVGEASVI